MELILSRQQMHNWFHNLGSLHTLANEVKKFTFYGHIDWVSNKYPSILILP